MVVLVALWLAVLVFAFVAYPLLEPRFSKSSTESVEDAQLRELYFKRDAAYSAIEELGFDFESGSLSKGDYRDLEVSYKRKAISILRDIDEREKSTKVEDEIERQVLELRQAKGLVCPQCGVRYHQGDRFCSQCGTSLNGRELS